MKCCCVCVTKSFPTVYSKSSFRILLVSAWQLQLFCHCNGCLSRPLLQHCRKNFKWKSSAFLRILLLLKNASPCNPTVSYAPLNVSVISLHPNEKQKFINHSANVCLCGRETCLACLVLLELKTHNILMRIFTICGQHLSFVLMVDKLNVQFVIFVIFLFVCCCCCYTIVNYVTPSEWFIHHRTLNYIISDVEHEDVGAEVQLWMLTLCRMVCRDLSLNAVYPFVWLRSIYQRLIDWCKWMYRKNSLGWECDWTSKCVLGSPWTRAINSRMNTMNESKQKQQIQWNVFILLTCDLQSLNYTSTRLNGKSNNSHFPHHLICTLELRKGKTYWNSI